jgi:hypothetical protein
VQQRHSASDVNQDWATLHCPEDGCIDQILVLLASSNTDDDKIRVGHRSGELIGRIGSDIVNLVNVGWADERYAVVRNPTDGIPVVKKCQGEQRSKS